MRRLQVVPARSPSPSLSTVGQTFLYALVFLSLVFLLFSFLTPSLRADSLPNTQPLTTQGDIASQMIDGIDRFLLKETDKAIARRMEQWKPGDNKDQALLKQRRAKLAQILGLVDPRPAKVEMELLATTDQPAIVGKSDAFEVHAVRWNAFGDVHGEGLLLTPVGKKPLANVIAIPDADQTPEMIAGLEPGVAPELQFAKRLAETGCRVIVPVLIDRHVEKRIAPGRTTGPELTNREFLHRAAYVLGRTVAAYEVNKVLAVADWFKQQDKDAAIGVFGRGEGGRIALYAAAIDARIDEAGVSGYFGNHDQVWKEPIDRNSFGLVKYAGDAELMVLAQRYDSFPVIEVIETVPFKITGKGAAPGEIGALVRIREEADRAIRLLNSKFETDIHILSAGDAANYSQFITALHGAIPLIPKPGVPPQNLNKSFDPALRQSRQLHELERHNAQVLRNSPNVRREFLKKLDTTSLEKYEASAKPYRETFYNDVIGRFDQPLLPLNPRTRKTWDNEKWTGYEVMLDVFPDVFAYGVLLLPKDLKPGEKRPVVVCQHGLEGRPTDTFLNDNKFYHDYAARLAERGFITFAPQNPYIFTDRFRTLQRKANPIGKTLFSIIIPQHQQIINFLKSLPGVDEKRIAFYGLSYGGKTAMRVPAVLTDYCLSICSADFNEWVWKNAGTDHPYSYVYTGEYEIFEWNLGSTFNYAEMAALIAPRPFMVERGHFDGVSSDEMVAFEFAKVRRLYNGQLKIGDRCEIEFFAGPHTINGKGTFDFLHKHLNWEKK